MKCTMHNEFIKYIESNPKMLQNPFILNMFSKIKEIKGE